MKRARRKTAGDLLLGQQFDLAPDGFVRVVDYLGSDQAVVQAARVSYGRGTKKVSEDRGLIRYLMRHRHTTPFEMCEIKLHVRVPMDTWRQWIRHRTASVNEYSTRYSIAIDSCATTGPGNWRMQASTKKQGSDGFLPKEVGGALSREERGLHAIARQIYSARIKAGVAREQARKDLPLSTYTEAYWKIDLHNLLHFLELRMDAHAQEEIRVYANVIGEEIVGRWCPLVWEAFTDYRRQSMQLTRMEIEIIQSVARNDPKSATDVAARTGWLKRRNGELVANRERAEAETKLEKLGLLIPWRSRG